MNKPLGSPSLFGQENSPAFAFCLLDPMAWMGLETQRKRSPIPRTLQMVHILMKSKELLSETNGICPWFFFGWSVQKSKLFTEWIPLLGPKSKLREVSMMV